MTLSRPLALFYIRAENDLDHAAPVIDALLKRDRVDVRAIVYDPLKSFEDDLRIRYLTSTYGLRCCHIFKEQSAYLFDRIFSSWLQHLLRQCLRQLRRTSNRRVYHLLMGTCRYLRRFLEARIVKLAKSTILASHLTSRSRGVLVFDHTMGPFPAAVTSEAQAKGFRVISLPHAVVHREDAPDNPGDEEPDAPVRPPVSRPPGSHGGNLYDAVVVPNAFVADRMIKRGMLPEKVYVLGAARFCDSWVRKLRLLQPSFSTGGSGKRVLFLLSKNTRLVDWSAVERVVAHLAATPDIDAVIKVHPRSELSGLSAKNAKAQVTLAPTNASTVSLIDWADIVIFWASSAIYDALRVNKPILQLGFITKSPFDFEGIIPSWQARSFDSFRARLADFLKGNHATYSAAEAVAALRDLCDGGTENVPETYASFIEGAAEGAAFAGDYAGTAASRVDNSPASRI